jgi:hypothetical protein
VRAALTQKHPLNRAYYSMRGPEIARLITSCWHRQRRRCEALAWGDGSHAKREGPASPTPPLGELAVRSAGQDRLVDGVIGGEQQRAVERLVAYEISGGVDGDTLESHLEVQVGAG